MTEITIRMATGKVFVGEVLKEDEYEYLIREEKTGNHIRIRKKYIVEH